MRRSTRPAVMMALPIAAWCLAGSALASCFSPRLINAGYSHPVNPGCFSVDCGSRNTSLTEDVRGSFWVLTNGRPAFDTGIDNGRFPALGGWLYIFPGYPAYISTNWAADARIDGCVDFGNSPRCTGILLSDIDPDSGDGVFALMTKRPDTLGNYDFSQPGDIVLNPIPAPTITGSMRSPFGGLITVRGPSLEELEQSLYLDPECAELFDGTPVRPVEGFRVYGIETAVGAAPPAERDIADWTLLTDVLPPGEETMITVDCSAGAADQWLAIGIAFDSGFETPYVSRPSTRIACGPNLAEPDDEVSSPIRQLLRLHR